jgi:zinc protease
MEIQADAYARSLIDGEELRRELEVIIEEAKRKADNPGAVATETLYELLHDRHRIRRWRIGREHGLRSLTADAVRKFYRAYYHPGNTVLSIVGDVDPDRVLAEAEALYGALPAGTIERSRGVHEEGAPGFRYRELAGDILQTQLALGWRAPRVQAGNIRGRAARDLGSAAPRSRGRDQRARSGARQADLRIPVDSPARGHGRPGELPRLVGGPR